MTRFEFELTHSVKFAFTLSVNAKDRRAAERRFGQLVDSGACDGELTIKTGGGWEISEEGEPVVHVRRNRRRRRR